MTVALTNLIWKGRGQGHRLESSEKKSSLEDLDQMGWENACVAVLMVNDAGGPSPPWAAPFLGRQS